MTDATRPPMTGSSLPKRQGNHLGNTAAVRQPIARLQRTIRDAQAIARRHPDNVLIQTAALELAEMCRARVRDETRKETDK